MLRGVRLAVAPLEATEGRNAVKKTELGVEPGLAVALRTVAHCNHAHMMPGECGQSF
ncbi:hypothetical protein GCM10010207_85310 [Streptomyces atratus]|nr:hypothetical protein GCM10010207_85310 [Streptomyces atratus]